VNVWEFIQTASNTTSPTLWVCGVGVSPLGVASADSVSVGESKFLGFFANSFLASVALGFHS
jgi:hypothetical protein